MKSSWWQDPAPAPDAAVAERARARQSQLTKPPGALGYLEELAITLAAMQGQDRPAIDSVWISVFAADHGVAEEGVSAFPQAVTAEMIRNFARGGAAISVLARNLGATLEVVDVGAITDIGSMPGVVSRRVGSGTRNLCKEPAMTAAEMSSALAAGREAAARARAAGVSLFIGGEMGIANTTAAAALACKLLRAPAALLAGPGTGLTPEGVSHKARVIDRACTLHHAATEPAEILRCLGGFEIAALAGAYIAAAQDRLPVLVDGYIAIGAALCAQRMNATVAPWLFYSHRSAEPGYRAISEAVGARPILDLGMRLGEGSGAAMAVPVLRMACALHNEMATFAEAAVSERV